MLIEEDLSSYRYVKPERMPVCGVTGLTSDEKYIYAATQNMVIAVMARSNLQLASFFIYHKIKDPHSILADGNRLLVVASGLNAVYECPLENGFVKEERLFWKSSDEELGRDVDHFNSIIKYGNRILVTGFGLKNGMWSSAKSGYAVELGSGERLVEGLEHPHTIMECGGELVVCESSRGAVVETSRKKEALLNGYTRGLCVGPQGLYAATSAGRKVSRSTGVENQDIEKKKFRSGIYLLDPVTLETKRYLAIPNREFYDLMVVGPEALNWTYS